MNVSLWPPHRAPARLRAAGYGLALLVLTYLCLAPRRDRPSWDKAGHATAWVTLAPGQGVSPVSLWDKVEHAAGWFVLTAIGLAFWPGRPGRVTIFALAFGAVIEVLQPIRPGRDRDWLDWVGDCVGVVLAILAWAAARGLARRAAARA